MSIKKIKENQNKYREELEKTQKIINENKRRRKELKDKLIEDYKKEIGELINRYNNFLGYYLDANIYKLIERINVKYSIYENNEIFLEENEMNEIFLSLIKRKKNNKEIKKD